MVKKGIKLTEDEAKAFVASQSQGQIFQGRLKSDGRITASRPNEIFQVDLIDYTKRVQKDQGIYLQWSMFFQGSYG